jgi:SAM-dependent methyltransferase
VSGEPGDVEAQTKALFRSIALERQGYYDSKPGPPRLSFWQGRVRRTVERILDARLEKKPPLRRLLDAGCGRGDFTLALAERYPQLEEVLGCDFSPELLALARSSAAGNPRVSFSAGDLTSLPFEPASVDVVVCLNVLHHIRRERRPAALGELARVSARTLLLEIKNAESLYFGMHSRRVEGVEIFPATVTEVRDRLRSGGFELVGRHAIFGLTWLSPLVVLHFERGG